VLFAKGAPRLAIGQDEVLLGIVRDVRELDALAEVSGQRFRLEVTGHTDADGPPESNLPLSRARAEIVHAAIGRDASARLDLVIEGLGSRVPVILSQNESDKQQNRRVTIRVIRPAG
jgi:outer membrane protein OmpA-like peptidoglycan-associated protein